MTAADGHQAKAPDQRWIDRAIWAVAILLVVAAIGFGAYYIQDRYLHADESLVERRSSHMEELVQQNPSDPDLRVAVAQWYLEKGLVDQAVEQGEEALRLQADHQGALILLGQAYRSVGDIDQAIAQLSRVAELNRHSEFAAIDTRMNLVHYQLGELYSQKGEYESAAEAYQSALIVDRTDADARYSLALVYQALGDHTAAVEQLTEALRYVPGFAEAYEGLLVSYQALEMRDEAAYAEAMVAYSRADYWGAAEQLKQVIQSSPEFAPTYLGLGLAYEKLGEKEQAVAALEQYLQLEPDSFAAQHILGRLGVKTEAP